MNSQVLIDSNVRQTWPASSSGAVLFSTMQDRENHSFVQVAVANMQTVELEGVEGLLHGAVAPR